MCASMQPWYTEDDKFRYYIFEIYEESVRPDWEQVLRDSGMQFAISPWHREDLKEDGTLKKAHRHGIYHTAGNQPVSVKTVKKRLLSLDIAANGHIEPARDAGVQMRYLIHLDNPEKSQFEGGRNEIMLFGGFPLDLTRVLTKEELREVKKSIFDRIRDMSITEYSELLDDLLYVLGDDDMFEYASNHTILFKGYLDSKRFSTKG